jgi:hypothetical protein
MRRKQVVWPSLAQAFFQIVMILVVSGLWGALLFGFLNFSVKPEAIAEAAESSSPAASQGQGEASSTPTVTPTRRPVTPTQAATLAPTKPASTPTPAAQADEINTPAANKAAEASATPTVVPTDPPTPEATPTESAAPSPTAETIEAGDTGGVSFKNDVFPILERRCVKCHGGINDDGEERIEEGLKLTSYDDLIAGSYNGPVIEPGNVENSFLIEQIVKGKMPKKEPRLLPKEIELLTEWVRAGAPDN